LLVLPAGRGHGWDLLSPNPDGGRPAPDADISAFLAQQLPTPAASACPGPVRQLTAGSLTAELSGSGRTTVVLSNERGEDVCAWQELSTTLNGKGFRVARWNYGLGEPADELAAIVAALHRDAAGPIVLVGASEGAKASLVAARRLNAPYVAGVVSLSAEA